MRKKLLLLLGLFLVMACSSTAFAAVTLKRIGDHPFFCPPLTSEAEFRAMVDKNAEDIRIGFEQAGYGDLYPEFVAQFPNAKVETIQVAPGDHMDWMLFRRKGTGPVKTVKDVTWGGEASFDAFSFAIDKDGQRYNFIVPYACGNLSLMNVAAVPAPVNQEPVCSMTVSGGEVKCGDKITVDASASTDAEGAIAQVIFRLVDANNQVVAEQVDTEAPYVQEFTVPCESTQYAVKVVVVDAAGAESSPTDCTQTITVAERKGGPIVDLGYARQTDPADYLFGRVGYEYFLNDRVSAIGAIGGFVRVHGDDGGSAFIADALMNYYFNDKMFVGGGIGLWAGEDDSADDETEIDLIANMGYKIHENERVKTSLFVEGRFEADELVSSLATRLGVGLRFQF